MRANLGPHFRNILHATSTEALGGRGTEKESEVKHVDLRERLRAGTPDEYRSPPTLLFDFQIT